MKWTILCPLLIAALLTGEVLGQSLGAQLEKDLREVAAYETGKSLAPLKCVERETLSRLSDPDALHEWVHILGRLALDRSTTLEGAAWLIHQLGLTGDSMAVPYLEQLGQRQELMDDARMALELIQAPEASAVLRAWAERATGTPAVGLLRALSNHPSETTTSILLRRMGDPSTAVVAAAAMSLADLGRLPDTVPPVLGLGGSQLRLRSAGTRARAGDRSALSVIEALAMDPSQPAPIRIAALASGAELAPTRFVPLLIRTAVGPDEECARCALSLFARVGNPEDAVALAGELDRIHEARRSLVISALAECGDHRVVPLVRRWLDSSEPTTRAAAALLWAARGESAEAAELLARARRGDEEAFQALASMRSSAVVAPLQSWLSADDVRGRILAARLVASRVQTNLIELVRRQAEGATSSDEITAMVEALAEIGDAGDLPLVLRKLRQCPEVSSAIESACIRWVRRGFGAAMHDALARGGTSTNEPVPWRQVCIRVLAQIPDPEALKTLSRLVEDPDGAIRSAAARALTQVQAPGALDAMLCAARSGSLSDADRDPLLLALLQRTPSDPSALPLIAGVREWSGRPQIRTAIASALGRIRSAASLDLAVEMILESETAREELLLAAVTIAKGLLDQDPRAVVSAAERVRSLPNADSVTRGLLDLGRQAQEKLRSRAAEDAERQRVLLDSFRAAVRRSVVFDAGGRCEAKDGQLSLRCGGAPYTWEKARSVDPWNASVAFAPEELALEVGGLDTTCVYRIGLSWWDFDGNGRTQSVWLGRTCVLPPVPLPNGTLGHGPIEFEWGWVPTSTVATLTIRRHGRSNVVLGGAWVFEFAPRSTGGRRKRILVATGEEYPGHPWPRTSEWVKDLSNCDPELAAQVQTNPDTWLQSSAQYDAVVLNYMNWTSPTPSVDRLRRWAAAISNGTGLVLVHFASGAFRGWSEYVAIAGRIWNPQLPGHDPRGLFVVRRASEDHPLLASWPDRIMTYDELYTCLDGATPVHVLAVAQSRRDGRDYPMVMAHSYGTGRVIHIALGHDETALSVRAVSRLYHRAVRWAAGLPPVP